jgi:hypothetical protein
MQISDMTDNRLSGARKAVLQKLQLPHLSVSDLLKLLAISFTNTPVVNVLDHPFLGSSLDSARSITWSQIVANGICLIQEDNRVIFPFHLVPQVLDRELNERAGLDQHELALLDSLKELSFDVETPYANLPAWLSWEAFGVNFYCIRINSFLVLGISSLPLSHILRGSQLSSDIFKTLVNIKSANAFHAAEKYGPDLPQKITRKNASFQSVEWVGGENLQVVLNGDDGAGVDIFFILERTDGSGYIVVLDQRKRLGVDITDSNLSVYRQKVPSTPKFLKDKKLVSVVYGLVSIYSKIKIVPVPKSTFFVSSEDSRYFHGSLLDHPGCSMTIDVNSALKNSIGQIFLGNNKRRTELAENVIQHRKMVKFENAVQLLDFVASLDGNLDDSALPRIKF